MGGACSILGREIWEIKMIKTIIFDIGRVLVDWNWEEYLRGLFDGDTATAVGEAYFMHPDYNEFDRGVLSTEEILQRFIKTAPHLESEIRLCFSRMGETVVQREFSIPWIKELRAKGYQVLFLSNYSYQMRELNPEALSFVEYMDGGVFSCDVKKIKPDRDIFECIIEKYNLDPKECIFIDDNCNNIATANSIGIHGITFESYNQVREEMEKLL